MNETILMHLSEEAAKRMPSLERLMRRQPITACKESKGVLAA